MDFCFSQCGIVQFMNALTKSPTFSKLVFSRMHLCIWIHVPDKGGSSADGTTRQSEGVWHRTVELTDNFIYPFLPAGVAVSSSPNG